MPRPLIARLLTTGLALALGAALAADPPKTSSPPQSANPSKAGAPVAGDSLVDINKASRGQLKMLPGIGDAEASRIIEARPYLTKSDLVTKNVLPLQAYDELRGKIVVVHKGPPPKPKP